MQRLFTMFSSRAVKVLCYLVAELKVKEGQVYTSREVVLAVSWSGFVLDGIVSCLEDYDEHENII